jgi:peptidoglycan/xylan/chitin deacetylase (PgdA/CDA1 family)
MRLGLGRMLLRASRLDIASILPWSRQSAFKKHVKIDDEEQQSGDYHDPLYRGATGRSRMKMLLLSLLALLLLVLLIAHVIYKPPTFVIDFLQRKYPDVLFHVPLPSDQKIVALTLDDAPSGETAKILDVLKTYGAKATFFIIGGQVSAHPEMLKRIHDEGHEVGNHAWADEPSINLPLSELKKQIKEVEALLPANHSPTTHGPPKYFRPGSGLFNKKMVALVTGLHYRVVLGSIFPFDPQIHSAQINAAHVLSMVKPGGIIIMHDRRSYSAEQVELVLKGLAAQKWTVVSLGGLLAAGDARGKTAG